MYALLDKVGSYVSSGMPFFPEYTDHSMDHINATLDFALKLIPDEMFDILEPEAIELLVAAILFHDLGMFIQKDGLEQLVFGTGKDTAIDHIDIDLTSGKRLTWSMAWENYYKEVRRYSQQKIDSEFGLDANGEKINILLLQSDKIDMNYAKVYGGFLRRYHPRLAHDIAMNGFIGTNGDRNDILAGISPYQRKIIGITARSHGMNLRDTEYFLSKAFPTQQGKPHGIPIFYLMAILRMADYLHAGEKRATKEKQHAQRVVTLSSLHEISWNQAVYDNMNFDVDKRQIHVYTEPENSKVFLALEKWLNDVQRELDLCWAVLDEKYHGTYKLSIHRVVSDVFNETKKDEWRKTFLPRKAELSVNPEIVKLMIAPLYGNNPSYGVRELLQNAIDACNEREEIERAEEREYTGKITVEVDTKNKKFTITDNGVGMNEDVLINYYLTVGASYRRSASWAAQHMDDEGKSRVVRSGRFGVGVMAAFLLGENVTVTTRHHKDDRGYRFSFNAEGEILNIERIENAIVGTVIAIDLTKDAANILEDTSNFDWTGWYHNSRPVVTYICDGLEQSRKDIVYLDKDRQNWFHFESSFFDNVKWSLNNPDPFKDGFPITYMQSSLFCNGIKIERPLFPSPFLSGETIDSKIYGYKIFPRISICDKNGVLDLSLDRNSVNSFPETEQLLYDVYSGELASVLVGEFPLKFPKIFLEPFPRSEASDCIFNEHGFTLNQHTFLLHAKYDTLFIIFRNRPDFDFSGDFQNLGVIMYDVYGPLEDSGIEIAGEDIFFEFGRYNSMVKNIWGKVPPKSLDPFEERENIIGREQHSLGADLWHFTSEEGGPKLPVPNNLVLDDTMPFIVELDKVDPKIPDERNIMLQVLRKYLPHRGQAWDGWIPLALEDRVKRYPNAFVELFKYIPKDRQTDIRKLLVDMNLTPLED